MKAITLKPRGVSARVAKMKKRRQSSTEREAIARLYEGAGPTFIDLIRPHVSAVKNLPTNLSTNRRYLAGLGK